jgi:predicted nucleotidyltransferase
MRITDFERTAIVNAVRQFDANAPIWLFGSRTDDRKKGGDIDIAVLSNNIGVMEKIKIRQSITDSIGDQKIDIVVSKDGSDPFFHLAVKTGITLHE